jgi:uncharacterized membrane protein YgdD (TMEM256/DUF423 family)
LTRTASVGKEGMRASLVFAGILGFLGVLLGAVGAHLLKDQLSPKDLAIFETAARYQIFHALAILAVSGRKGRFFRIASVLWIAGVLIFSGSLYLIVFTQVRSFGALAPVGGLALMGGWLCVAAGAVFRARAGK